jgi:hypothetical protein
MQASVIFKESESCNFVFLRAIDVGFIKELSQKASDP